MYTCRDTCELCIYSQSIKVESYINDIQRVASLDHKAMNTNEHICTSVPVPTCRLIHSYTLISTRLHTHICMCMYMFTDTHIRICTCKYMYIYMNSHAYKHVNKFILQGTLIKRPKTRNGRFEN